MTKALAKKEKAFEVKSVPHGLIMLAKEADGDVEELAGVLEFEYPEVILTRENLREILRYVAKEDTLDAIAGAPPTQEALTGLIDDAMYREIKRLNREVKNMSKIAEQPDHKLFILKTTKEEITPPVARDRLSIAMNRLSEYSKIISDRKKSEGGDGTNLSVNLAFSMTEMVSEGLARLDDIIDIEPEKE